jgi:hypothetical protein
VMNDSLPPAIYFKKEGPFWNYVMSTMIGLGGYLSFSDPANPMQFDDDEMVMDSFLEPRIAVTFDHIRTQVMSGVVDSAVFSSSLTQMLVSTCYESVKDRKKDTPLWEFFRHIRNAASHNNRFFFSESEPKRPAVWRKFEIDDSAKGHSHPLFGTACINEYLATADIFILLREIEQDLER